MPHADAEEARARFIELFPAGFEEVERSNLVELVAYTDPDTEQSLKRGFAQVAAEDVEPGWEERWREFHRPLRVGRVWIVAPWHLRPSDGPCVVVDPGRAFGTGGHASTRLCLQLLQQVAFGSFLDVGCGSGVVAIAAAQLGFEPVVAVDVDEHAVEATVRNARANGVVLRAFRADARTAALPAADVAVANLTRELVERIVPRLECRLVITAGYLEADDPQPTGFTRVQRLGEDGWAADLLERVAQ